MARKTTTKRQDKERKEMSEEKKEFKPFLTQERWEQYWSLAVTLDKISAELRERDELVLAAAIANVSDALTAFGKEFSMRETKEFNRFHEQN